MARTGEGGQSGAAQSGSGREGSSSWIRRARLGSERVVKVGWQGRVRDVERVWPGPAAGRAGRV